MTMADTVAVMNKGRIEQMGAPEQLYELPRTAFVANFLGQSNLFTGPVVESTGTHIGVDVGGIRIAVPLSRAARHTGEVTVGVRPEKLAMHQVDPGEQSGRNHLGPGRVIDVSFTGMSTQYLVAVPAVGTMTVFAQNAQFGPVAQVGDTVWLSWSIEHSFGLEDDAVEVPRFPADDDTRSIATARRDALMAELDEG